MDINGLGNSSSVSDGEQPNNSEIESKSARVVATSFDAELVAIGDVFTTIDQVGDLNSSVPMELGSPIMVTLVDQTLEFVPVDL